ncbi:hypothetical protein F511_14846 [Dorcoceras hygrometricum]|uniref:Uncharacterized protein n=1 Tax=Dorcoceras hygrometricum TaxID=472368 RepID=A0A2Z7D3A9_9LAMI|nr:hypothetical protein F511_14846 [Dorcoceras hygrometricum]
MGVKQLRVKKSSYDYKTAQRRKQIANAKQFRERIAHKRKNCSEKKKTTYELKTALALQLNSLHLLIVMTSLLMSSSLIPDPAPLFTTADLHVLALLLVFLHLLNMTSSPITSSSMVHLDVPAGSLLMYQMIHLPLLALEAGSYRSS